MRPVGLRVRLRGVRCRVAAEGPRRYIATEWALVARMQKTTVLREAKASGELLYWCQAVDRVPSGMTKETSEKLLLYPNATDRWSCSACRRFRSRNACK